MATATLTPPAADAPAADSPALPLHTFSASEYEALIAAGFLSEDTGVELLEGVIIAKMSKGPRQESVSFRVLRLAMARLGSRHDMRPEASVTLSPDTVVEPDLWIARAPLDTFSDRRPTPADLLLVVEVADASLRTDRAVKLPRYAASGVPEVWIVNLPDAQLERYVDPRAADAAYATAEVFTAGEVFAHDLLGEVDVSQLLGGEVAGR